MQKWKSSGLDLKQYHRVLAATVGYAMPTWMKSQNNFTASQLAIRFFASFVANISAIVVSGG
jgi:hypothetical protein